MTAKADIWLKHYLTLWRSTVHINIHISMFYTGSSRPKSTYMHAKLSMYGITIN